MIKVVIILLLIIIAALLIVGVVDGNRFVVAKQQFVLPNLRKNCRRNLWYFAMRISPTILWKRAKDC